MQSILFLFHPNEFALNLTVPKKVIFERHQPFLEKEL